MPQEDLLAAIEVVKRRKLFHGWYIVAVAFLALFMSTGLRDYSQGVFMKPMSEELEWSRGAISSIQAVGLVINGLFGLFIGSILDRRGGRALMLFGAVVTGLGFIALGFVQEIWHFFLIRGLVLGVGTLCLGNLVANVAVSNWFIRKRGRAIAMAAMGVPFAGVIITPLSQVLIDNLGWRNAWTIIGAMVLVVMLAPIAIFVRRRPEDMGLRPDGDPPSGPDPRSLSAVQVAAMKADVVWTLAQVVRTRALWLIMIAFGLSGMGLFAMIMHIVPYVSDIGYAAAVAAGVQSIQAAASMASKLVWGLLLERFEVRVVSVLSFACAATGMGLLLASSSIEMVVLSLIVFALGMGGQGPIQEVVWANYFGRLSLGTVRSIGMPFMIATGAAGPIMTGLVYDATSSYQIAFITLIGAYCLAGALMMAVRPPRHPDVVSGR